MAAICRDEIVKTLLVGYLRHNMCSYSISLSLYWPNK